MILMEKKLKLLEPFRKKNCKKKIKKSFELKKCSREKVTEWIFSRTEIFRRRVKVELYLSNYATKADLKIATGVYTLEESDLANLKFDVDKLDIDKLKNVPNKLSNLKSKVDKLDADKLVPVPVDLSKLSDVVKISVVKKLNMMN